MDYFCYRCQKPTPSKSIQHSSGVETICAACGWQVDFDHADEPDDDYGEPIGSCANCQTNIYESEDDGSGLCDQCQWFAAGCPGPPQVITDGEEET